MLFLARYVPPQTQEEQQLQQRLQSHVEVLAGLIGPRHLGKRHSMEAAAAYIGREFAAIGCNPQPEAYMVGEMEAVNIIAQRDGSRRDRDRRGALRHGS